MPPKKSKKKTQAGNARGFATISVPSKVKETVETLEDGALRDVETVNSEPDQNDTAVRARIQAELKVANQSSQIVENGTKAFNRYCSEIDVEKRSRKTCITLSLPESNVCRILELGKDFYRSLQDEKGATTSMTQLFTGELLLQRLGLPPPCTERILSNVDSLASADELLYHMALHTAENVVYDAKVKNVPIVQEETRFEKLPTKRTVPITSRVNELLSDEEDQDIIENDPNSMFIQNQLALLVLRSKSRKDSSVMPALCRLQKRSRVIEAQLNFDRKFCAQEVQRAVRDGHLQRASAASRGTDEKAVELSPASSSDASSIQSDDEWLAVQATNESRTSIASDASDAQPGEALVTGSENGMAPSIQGREDDLLVNMFETMLDTTNIPSDREVDVGKRVFPIILPKSSQNISPISLLRTHLKRADKNAREEFYDLGTTLVIRFSSSRVSRRQVIVQETRYSFPDQDTARNYLSMKALSQVPELVAEKAGGRFSGVFRAAWQLLQEEEEESRRLAIAERVQNVRNIYQKRPHAVPDVVLEAPIASPSTDPTAQGKRHFRRPSRDLIDFGLDDLWMKLCNSEPYYAMLNYRQTLPIAAYRDALLYSIQHNQVTILCGETGCGKSTQLPTFILEHCLSQSRPCRIYVTEPRRISAISLATRVSAELGENRKAIANGESLLGFSIRLDSQISDKSRLIYATTGIVLRMLEDNNDLGGITHLIIDEVHERSIESDFLLIVVKRLLHTRRDLKVVLMSATLQAERFNDYFGGQCSIFNVPGRTYPVEQRFLEDAIEASGYICDENSFYAKRGKIADLNTNWELPDEDEDEDNEEDLTTYSDRTIKALKILDPYKVNFDLICQLLDHLAQAVDRSLTQAILVFLPGMGEIRRMLDALLAHKQFGDYRKWIVYALHSSVSSDKQQAAFEVPPRGVRKIVLATNIAETGITIPDITCVIDAGKHKESRFDARRQLSKLVECFIAQSNAKQRMGRAGRVQPGLCYHLFSKARYTKMEEHQLPEFQRLNLDELALRVKVVGMGEIESTLLEALDAPTAENIRRSIGNLIQVGALDDEQNLTPLGRHLAKLPVDTTLGKLILNGLKYSCLDPCLVIAAVLSSKTPFDNPIGREREASSAKQVFVRGDSDFLTVWTAYHKWRQVAIEKPQHEQKFCKDSYLSTKGLAAIEELRLQYIKILIDVGLLRIPDQDRRSIQKSRFTSSRDGFLMLPRYVDLNTAIPSFVEACLASAFYPNLLNVEDGLRTIAKGQPVTIHSSSINSHNRNFSKRWVVFYNLLKTKVATSAHDTGLVDDFIVALFCGIHVEIKPFSGVISIDHNRIKFKTRDLRTLVAFSLLRRQLQSDFAAFLDRKEGHDAWLEVLEDIIQQHEALARQNLK